MSEPMDLAMRLLKDISQGYSSVILNEPEQMLSMVDELGIRDHLPPDFTHEEGRFPHHMTLNMGHLPEGWEHGQPVDLTIDGWGIVNEPKAQAMAFRVNRESLPAPIDEERTPHISTMVGPNGKPMHSNQIVEWNDIEPFNVKGLVSGKNEKKSEPMDLAWRLLKMPIVSDSPEIRQLDVGPAHIHQFQDPVTGEVKSLYVSPASNPDSESLYAGIVGNNGNRASAKFNTGDGDYASLDGIETQEPFQRRGYMSAIYDAVEEYLQQHKKGRNLVPSDFQSDEGKAFWESRNKEEM